MMTITFKGALPDEEEIGSKLVEGKQDVKYL
jgi:hypothetical protein